MKNRRIVLVCFLLVAAMTIGIGYAALTDTLSVSGTASIDSDDSQETFAADVYFSKAVATEGRATATIGDQTNVDNGDVKNDAVTISVAEGIFKEVGDQVIVTLTVKSESDLPVYVSVDNFTNDASAYFSVTVVPTGFAADSTAVIQPHSTLDYVVTIEQIATAVTDQTLTFGFGLNVSTSNPNA